MFVSLTTTVDLWGAVDTDQVRTSHSSWCPSFSGEGRTGHKRDSGAWRTCPAWVGAPDCLAVPKNRNLPEHLPT